MPTIQIEGYKVLFEAMSVRSKRFLNSAQRPVRQPGGLPENSRGLRSATTTPPVAIEIGRDPGGGAETRGILRAGKFCDPIRVVGFGGRVPGVSLRSTPGYFLTSLRDVGSHLAGWI